MILSRACEHAIRTMIYVAAHADGRPIGIRAIARDLDVPSTTLAKVVQILTRHGLLAAQKGPGGGVMLARPAEQITPRDVMRLIDGRDLEQTCILGLPGCSDASVHCPLHDQWGRVRDQMTKMLANTTIAQLARRVQEGRRVFARDARPASEGTTGSLGARGGRRI